MIKAVLLDLDDTLLFTDTNAFVERYLAAMGKTIIERHPDLAFASLPVHKAIMLATRATIENLDPTRTNMDVFNEAAAELLNLPVETLQTIFDDFHEDPYRQLASGTRTIPVARLLINRLLMTGMSVTVATNPIFGSDAIMQRLAWAGIDKPIIPYALVTHIENMHFTKPNPHYYEEILARVGIEADEAIMVGDSIVNDIIPAGRAGLNTFWITDGNSLPADLPADLQPDEMGTLADFDQRVSDGWLATLKPRSRTVDQIEPRMLGNVAALFGLTQNINPDHWTMHPDPKEWSPLETLCHLRDSERNIQRPRLKKIVAEENPFISQPPPPFGPGERDISAEQGDEARYAFWQERCETLTFLSSLQPEDWERPARHSIFGPTTLLEMAHFTARHDHLHISQLCQTLGSC
jgi:FMN phosphatase YigB (HAD superfamily)